MVQFTNAFRDMDGVRAEMDLSRGMFVIETKDLVRDLLNSVLDEVVGSVSWVGLGVDYRYWTDQ